MAFEVQLSSTYVNIMRQRRHFYLTEGGLLFWVLPAISEVSRRQFQDDVLFPNNCNMFAIDDETRGLSLARSQVVLRCGYLEPIQEGWQLRERWHEKLVPISDLSIDLPNQRVFLFDYEKTRKRVEHAVRTVGGLNVLDEFRRLVEVLGQADAPVRWRDLKKRLPAELEWPLDCYGGHFFTAVAMYLSAREGRGVQWNYSLIQVAHMCADAYPYFLPLLEDAFRAFGRSGVFTDPRYADKWNCKKEKIRGEKPDDSARVQLSRLRYYREAMEWLMPEVRGGIARVFAA